MNAAVKQLASFRLESYSDKESFTRMLDECMQVYAEMWDKGYSRQAGHDFNPHLETLLGLVASGTRRFVTARIDGKIVALQNWYFMRDFESKTRVSAYMTGIYKRSPEVCDTVQFIRFGIEAMRAAGANQILLGAYAARPGLREKMEAAGGKVVEYVLEV
jgi:hypothetical protein